MRDGRLRRTGLVLSGRQQLERYIVRHRLTQAEAADQFGISRVQLNQYLNRERRPGLEVAIQIEDVTGIGIRMWLLDDLTEEPAKVTGNRDEVLQESKG